MLLTNVFKRTTLTTDFLSSHGGNRGLEERDCTGLSFILFFASFFIPPPAPLIIHSYSFSLLFTSPTHRLLFLTSFSVCVTDSLTEQLAAGQLKSGEFGFLLSLQLCATQANVALWLWWYCQAGKWHFHSKSQTFITFSKKYYLWGSNFSCLVSVQDWIGFRKFHKNQSSCLYFFSKLSNQEEGKSDFHHLRYFSFAFHPQQLKPTLFWNITLESECPSERCIALFEKIWFGNYIVINIRTLCAEHAQNIISFLWFRPLPSSD